jgi:hypothetical protein
LQSISASIEAVCRKTLQDGKLAFDHEGLTIWIADVHRGDGKRFVVHAAEKLTAFLELESATRASGKFL